MHRRLAPFLAATATLVALCGVGPSAHAADRPMLGAPTAGRCYEISADSAYDDAATSAKTVACSTKHDLFITGVVRVPAGTPLEGSAFQAFERTKCPYLDTQAVGGGRKYSRSAYGGFTFVPTPGQQSHGAHWLTCAVGIANAHGSRRGLEHTTGRPARLGNRIPARLRACSTSAFLATNCAAAHRYRTVADTVLTRTTQPSDAKLSSTCQRLHPAFKHDDDGYAWQWKFVSRSKVGVICLDN